MVELFICKVTFVRLGYFSTAKTPTIVLGDVDRLAMYRLKSMGAITVP